MHAVFPQQCDLCISMSGGFRAVTHLVALKSSYVGQTLQSMLHSEDTWQLVGNILVGGKHKHMLHRYYSMWRDFSKWSMKSIKRQYPFKFWQRNILYVSFPSSILFRTTIVKTRLFPCAVISTLWCDMPPFKCIVITDMTLIKTETAWKGELGWKWVAKSSFKAS